MKDIRKKILHKVKRVVIKIGSGVISKPNQGGLNSKAISAIAKEVADLKNQDIDVLIVSSGSIAAGIHELNIDRIPDSIPYKQAAAAIGQSHLIGTYEKQLKKNGFKVAQILLTHSDLTSRERYLNAKNTLSTILSHNVIPVINENDTVSAEEIKFGDNDTLSAMVSAMTEANLLIILSDVDGLYTKDPSVNSSSELIPTVEKITASIEKLAQGTASQTSVGGMITKIKAAKIASASGVPTIIVNGKKKKVISKVMAGENVGTIFLADDVKLKSKKHWIAYTLKPKGTIIIDNGAKKALTKNKKSLLPSGILDVTGHFKMGDAVSCFDKEKTELARGLTNYDSKDLERVIGKKTSEIEKVLGKKYYDEVIHRDNLVLTPKNG